MNDVHAGTISARAHDCSPSGSHNGPDAVELLPPLPQIIDSSMLTAWRSCESKYAFAYIHNLRNTGRNIHLTAGAAFAAGLEAARRYAFREGTAHLDDLLAAAFPSFNASWGDFEPLEEDHAKNFHNTFCALEYYLHHHHPLTDPIQPFIKADGTPAVEFTFAIPLPIMHPSGDPFIFAGRFDMLGLYHDLPCIVDEKTTSALGESWAKQFELRGQFLGYCWACKQLGYNVNNVFARGIALLKRSYNHITVPKQYPNYLIDRWYSQTCLTLSNITSAYHLAELGHGFQFNLGDACSAYGGCPYLLLCTAKEPTTWFDQYERETWNPLHKGAT